ncbi:MAG: SIMPL domain-containing protein [Candidatus Acidiferrales bacterium]
MNLRRYLLPFVVLVFPATAAAQNVQVDQQNRTIEIAATSSIEVVADRVTVTVGYHNYGPTHEAAFAQNARVAAKILKAWTDAGVPQKSISTNSLTSHFTSQDDLKDMAPAERKEKQYEVEQSWKITEKVDVAEKLLDIAVDAGANDVQDPEWDLADPDAAEAQAYASALEKARVIADQMAKSFGSKTGALLYASNQSQASRFLTTLNTVSVSAIAKKNYAARPETKLLPQKIEKSGYVRAIFALQ